MSNIQGAINDTLSKGGLLASLSPTVQARGQEIAEYEQAKNKEKRAYKNVTSGMAQNASDEYLTENANIAQEALKRQQMIRPKKYSEQQKDINTIEDIKDIIKVRREFINEWNAEAFQDANQEAMAQAVLEENEPYMEMTAKNKEMQQKAMASVQIERDKVKLYNGYGELLTQ